jgi:hypothetical protein
MRIKSITFGCLAAGLLIAAPQAMADPNVDSYLVVDVQSASGTVEVTSDLCMAAGVELDVMGFELQSTSEVGGNGGPDLTSFVFTKGFSPFIDDAATLFCIANIGDDDGGMGGMGGMGLGDLDDPGGPL